MGWREDEDLKKREEIVNIFEKNFRLESFNLNLDRKFRLLQEKVEETLKFDEAGLFQLFENLKRKLKEK